MFEFFPNYYKPSDKEIEGMWTRGRFVVDANVLLNLYRYGKTSQEDLLKVLGALGDRLWVPYQAALEYQRNRLSVIADQKNSYFPLKSAVNDARDELKVKLSKLNILGRHSSIDISTFTQRVEALFDTYISELDQKEKEHPGVSDHDIIGEKIDGVTRGKIGPAPTQDWVHEVSRKGADRYKIKTPPGFKDESEKKNISYSFNGIIYQAMYGDLFLWQQIIDYAKSLDSRPIIFITGDKKEDWWLKISGKTIGPHPELISEIKRETSASGFYMYESSRFLQYASNFLDVGIDTGSVAEVQDVSTADRNDLFSTMSPANSTLEHKYIVKNTGGRKFVSKVVPSSFETSKFTITVPKDLATMSYLEDYIEIAVAPYFPAIRFVILEADHSILVDVVGPADLIASAVDAVALIPPMDMTTS